jgi:hypothetical protein
MRRGLTLTLVVMFALTLAMIIGQSSTSILDII